jgi:hypothetical protein
VLLTAEIHRFYSGHYPCPHGVCTFHRAYLGDESNGIKSFKTVIHEVGHFFSFD